MVKLPWYLILCQCYLDTYNWCHVTLLPNIIFHCYIVPCPKYPHVTLLPKKTRMGLNYLHINACPPISIFDLLAFKN